MKAHTGLHKRTWHGKKGHGATGLGELHDMYVHTDVLQSLTLVKTLSSSGQTCRETQEHQHR